MKRRRLPSREREAEMFQRERARSVRHEASTEALPSGKEPKTGPKPPPYVKLRPHGATDLPNEAPAVPPPLVAYSSSDENSPGEMKQVIEENGNGMSILGCCVDTACNCIMPYGGHIDLSWYAMSFGLVVCVCVCVCVLHCALQPCVL